jgi:hypothetical protein
MFVGTVALSGQIGGNTQEFGGTIGGPQEPPCDLAPAPAMGPATAAHPMPSTMAPKARINDVMNAMMVPSSTTVWNSVATVTDATGVHETRPKTDEDWNIVYHAAVELAEVPNLLLVPGRERCLGGAVPLAYRTDFGQKARELQEAANFAVIAAKKHDVDALSEAGERIDVACDACHEKYQIAKGDPENWKKVLGTYKMTPEEAAAAAKDKAADLAAEAKAKAAAPPKPAAAPAPKK